MPTASSGQSRANLMRCRRRSPAGRRSRPIRGGRRSCAPARLPADERAQVAAIGFSGQMHGVVLIDAAGQPVRPALLWPDTRAVREADVAGGPPPACPSPRTPSRRAWPVRCCAGWPHEPEALRAARWAVQPKDWLRIALGGDVAADPSDACATALATPACMGSRVDRRARPAGRPVRTGPSSARCGARRAGCQGAWPAGRRAAGDRRGRHRMRGARQQAGRCRRRAADDGQRRPDRRARGCAAARATRAASLSRGGRRRLLRWPRCRTSEPRSKPCAAGSATRSGPMRMTTRSPRGVGTPVLPAVPDGRAFAVDEPDARGGWLGLGPATRAAR